MEIKRLKDQCERERQDKENTQIAFKRILSQMSQGQQQSFVSHNYAARSPSPMRYNPLISSSNSAIMNQRPIFGETAITESDDANVNIGYEFDPDSSPAISRLPARHCMQPLRKERAQSPLTFHSNLPTTATSHSGNVETSPNQLLK